MYCENFLSLKRDRIKGGAYFANIIRMAYCQEHFSAVTLFEMLLLFLGSAIAQRVLSLHRVLNQHMERVDPLR